MGEVVEVTLYEYRAIVDSIYDGDTVRCSIDLGFGIWRRDEPLRLLGINAPEVRGEKREAGIASRDALRTRILGKLVWLRTVRPTVENFPGQDMRDKYGRYLATIWDEEGDVNAWMVEQGHAVSYMV